MRIATFITDSWFQSMDDCQLFIKNHRDPIAVESITCTQIGEYEYRCILLYESENELGGVLDVLRKGLFVPICENCEFFDSERCQDCHYLDKWKISGEAITSLAKAIVGVANDTE